MAQQNNDIVHENETYRIFIGLVDDPVNANHHLTRPGYLVQNKNTDVIEAKGFSLPELINAAEHAQAYLKNGLWKWIAAHGARSRDEQESVLVPELEVAGQKPN